MNSVEITQEYDQHLGPVNTITFVDENRRFVTTSDDKTIRAWDFDIPVVIKYIAEPHMHSMPAVTVHPNSKQKIAPLRASPRKRWRPEKLLNLFSFFPPFLFFLCLQRSTSPLSPWITRFSSIARTTSGKQGISGSQGTLWQGMHVRLASLPMVSG